MKTRMLVVISITLCVMGAIANARAQDAAQDMSGVRRSHAVKQCSTVTERVSDRIVDSEVAEAGL